MSNSNRAMNRAFSACFISLTVIFSNWAFSQSEFSGSYKCTAQIANGLKKENGVVRPQRFYANSEFFVTHTSDFPDSVLDAWLSSRNASEAEMQSSYEEKRKTVSNFLFDIDGLIVGKYSRLETGSFWLREASDNPLETSWWRKCKAYSSGYDRGTRITCNATHNLFQMHTMSGEFTSAYIGSLHDPKTAGGYEGDTPSVKHGTCKPYYP